MSTAVPCDLFRRVQKRDGTIVDFDPDKISEAIFKAAQAVGGKDRQRAEILKEYVILDLARGHQDSTSLLNIEQIQDSIERVLVEKGHYRTARAYITYRNERAKRRALRGEKYFPSRLDDGVETLRDVSVWISSGDTIRWDRERIVRALVRETGLPYEDARRVSLAVEKEIIHSKISRLTASLIRELTNAQLLQMGYENERRLHSRLGLPIYDIEQRLFSAQGSRGGGSVESDILRQFAAEKVLPLAVSDRHGSRDLHVHDQDLIHRPLEIHLDLDFRTRRHEGLPESLFPEQSESLWEDFLSAWEREESRLLRVAGKRLVWENVNTSLYFHSMDSEVDSRKAVFQSLRKLWRHAGPEEQSPRIVWRLADRVDPLWRGRFIGTRQLSLLPEDELEEASQTVLLEVLARVEEVGPRWADCPVEFELVLDTRRKRRPDAPVVEAAAGCMAAGAPVRVLFRRDTAVSDAGETESLNLLQVVSLNFPRAAAVAEGDTRRLIEWLEDRLVLAAQAHCAKKNLLERLLKAGALSPLASAPPLGGGDHRLNPDEGLFGIGVWGLEEMMRIHFGKSPLESDEAFRELLEILASLTVRMKEISERLGIKLRLVANSSQSVADRLSAFLTETSPLVDRHSVETFLPGRLSDSRWLIREGKMSPFFAFGHAVLSLPGETLEWDRLEIAETIHFLASSTHVSGLTMNGTFRYCRTCGGRFEQRVPICDRCGGDSLFEVTRKKRGELTRATRL